MKSAMVVGSTGLVGEYLIRALVNSKKFNRVIAIVRKPYFNDNENIEEIIVDFNTESPLKSLNQVNHVFCCLGSTIKKAGSKKAFRFVDFDLPLSFARWAEQKKCDSFSLVTSMGDDSKSKIFYNRIKGEIEDEISKISILKIQIFRPSLIMGDRKEFRLGELLGKGVFSLLNPFMFGRLRKYKAIHARDIAQGMVAHLTNNQFRVKVFESNEIIKF